jgi:hypothetical protein
LWGPKGVGLKTCLKDEASEIFSLRVVVGTRSSGCHGFLKVCVPQQALNRQTTGSVSLRARSGTERHESRAVSPVLKFRLRCGRETIQDLGRTLRRMETERRKISSVWE